MKVRVHVVFYMSMFVRIYASSCAAEKKEAVEMQCSMQCVLYRSRLCVLRILNAA